MNKKKKKKKKKSITNNKISFVIEAEIVHSNLRYTAVPSQAETNSRR